MVNSIDVSVSVNDVTGNNRSSCWLWQVVNLCWTSSVCLAAVYTREPNADIKSMTRNEPSMILLIGGLDGSVVGCAVIHSSFETWDFKRMTLFIQFRCWVTSKRKADWRSTRVNRLDNDMQQKLNGFIHSPPPPPLPTTSLIDSWLQLELQLNSNCINDGHDSSSHRYQASLNESRWVMNCIWCVPIFFFFSALIAELFT